MSQLADQVEEATKAVSVWKTRYEHALEDTAEYKRMHDEEVGEHNETVIVTSKLARKQRMTSKELAGRPNAEWPKQHSHGDR